MNSQMQSMMGDEGEARAHQSMGRRFAGCASADSKESGSMMGEGMMGGGMMGGGMRGASAGSAAPVASEWTTADVVIVVLLGVVLIATLTGIVLARRWRRPEPGRAV
jgi:uncharacterized membrane protein